MKHQATEANRWSLPVNLLLRPLSFWLPQVQLFFLVVAVQLHVLSMMAWTGPWFSDHTDQ